MDDRHDQILVSNSLIDGSGLSYIGNHLIPYSTTTWNDPNHSYRAWGNDGSSYNLTMAVAGNTMVGSAIAQALVNCANGAGHLPVVLNLRVPAVAESTASIDFGTVNVGDPASQTLTVWNDAAVAKWTPAGIDDLNYTLATSAGFTAPGGSFIDAPARGTNGHSITMDTSTPGVKSGTITITSDAPDQPTLIVSVTGEVVDDPACLSDVNGDGESDVLDFLDYMDAFGTSENQPAPCGVGPVDADFNGDTNVDVLDFLDFFDAFGTGCP